MVVAAVCPVHGAFRSQGIEATNSSVSFSNVGETCPVRGCNRVSKVMEGSFYFDDEGVVEILSAPAWSKAAIKQVQQALSEAQYRIADLGEDPELVIEETASRLEHANPAFASKFKEKLNSTTLNSIRDYVALLLMFATLIATISPGAPAWDEQLYEKVLELNVENELLKEKVDELLRDSSKSENIEEDPEN